MLRNPTPPRNGNFLLLFHKRRINFTLPNTSKRKKIRENKVARLQRELRKAPTRKNISCFLFVEGAGVSGLCSSAAPGKTVFYISKSISLFWFREGRVRCSRRPDVQFAGNHFLFAGACRRFHFYVRCPRRPDVAYPGNHFCSQGPVVVFIFAFLWGSGFELRGNRFLFFC